MREHFDGELRLLNDDVLKMGIQVERALKRSMEALESEDLAVAEDVIFADRDIDSAEQRAEQRCAMIIAREQPVAGDLRYIITVFKLAWELERMGDHAKQLARSVGKVGGAELALALPSFRNMMDQVLIMMREALEAFAERDRELAARASRRDDRVDEIHDTLYDDLIGTLDEGTGHSHRIVPLLFLNRFMERLGDRVTNMCEWILYACTGERSDLH